jgi:Zn-finger nucleic acid-binding protein
MKCTSCKQGTLSHGYLDDLFPSHNCDHCGGNWVMLSDYLHWLEYAKETDLAQPDNVQVNEETQTQETKRAMLCPVTGAIMLKYRISKDNSHRIDLSPSVSGIWMDKGEWALIKSEGLAGCLNKIFTIGWQKDIKEQNAAAVLDASYRNQP